MFDKKEGTIVDLCEFNEPSLFEMANSHFSIPLTLPLLTSQAINKLSSNSKLFNTTNRRNLAHVINICDFNALFDSWKYKLEQFKLLMHIKHNNFGFSWNDSNLNQKSTENIKPFEFASKSSKPKPLVKRLKSTLKPCKLIERYANSLFYSHKNLDLIFTTILCLIFEFTLCLRFILTLFGLKSYFTLKLFLILKVKTTINYLIFFLIDLTSLRQ